MIHIIAIILGAGFGWYRAAKRGGNRNDTLQYAFGHAVAFFIVALFASILLRVVLG